VSSEWRQQSCNDIQVSNPKWRWWLRDATPPLRIATDALLEAWAALLEAWAQFEYQALNLLLWKSPRVPSRDEYVPTAVHDLDLCEAQALVVPYDPSTGVDRLAPCSWRQERLRHLHAHPGALRVAREEGHGPEDVHQRGRGPSVHRATAVLQRRRDGYRTRHLAVADVEALHVPPERLVERPRAPERAKQSLPAALGRMLDVAVGVGGGARGGCATDARAAALGRAAPGRACHSGVAGLGRAGHARGAVAHGVPDGAGHGESAWRSNAKHTLGASLGGRAGPARAATPIRAAPGRGGHGESARPCRS